MENCRPWEHNLTVMWYQLPTLLLLLLFTLIQSVWFRLFQESFNLCAPAYMYMLACLPVYLSTSLSTSGPPQSINQVCLSTYSFAWFTLSICLSFGTSSTVCQSGSLPSYTYLPACLPACLPLRSMNRPCGLIWWDVHRLRSLPRRLLCSSHH